MTVGRVATIGLLLTGTACQLVVDVSDYRFSDADAGGSVSQLEPLSTPDASPDPDAGSEPDSDTESESESDSDSDAGSEPDTESEPEPDPKPPAPSPPDPMYGCSIIEYCYAHQVQDTTDEERCIQRGCSLDEAIAECRAEIADLCGTAPRPPYVMITREGERVILN